jgi:hypothetical protein
MIPSEWWNQMQILGFASRDLALWCKNNIKSKISQTNITIFTLLMLVNSLTLHMLLDMHIIFIPLSMRYALSHVICVYYILYIVCIIFHKLDIYFFAYWMYIIPYNTCIMLCAFHVHCLIYCMCIAYILTHTLYLTPEGLNVRTVDKPVLVSVTWVHTIFRFFETFCKHASRNKLRGKKKTHFLDLRIKSHGCLKFQGEVWAGRACAGANEKELTTLQ